MKSYNTLEYVDDHYLYTLQLLAGRLCTEERFGAGAQLYLFPTPEASDDVPA